jgi:DNA-binding IclR family transcriptional regulator
MRTVQRVTALIRTLESSAALGVSVLARAIDADKATTHRILRALYAEGWVEQDSQRKYRLGPALTQLRHEVPLRSDIVAAATSVLDDLLGEVDETCFLSGRQGHENVVDLVRESTKEMRVVSEVGRRIPLHSGAAGKVLVAFEKEVTRARLLEHERQLLEEQGASFEEFLRDLDRVRKTGWCYDPGTFSPGIAGLAAPIIFDDETIIGAICVRAPDSRFTEEDARALAVTIVGAGRRVAASVRNLNQI